MKTNLQFIILLIALSFFLTSSLASGNSDYPKLISVSSNNIVGEEGSYNPVFSSDLRYVAFMSISKNFVSNDFNQRQDVFLRDLLEETTILISQSNTGHVGNEPSTQPSISGDGNLVAFTSFAYNFVIGDDKDGFSDIFLRNLDTLETIRISESNNGEKSNGHSRDPSISKDGHYVVFFSDATNLAEGNGNVFVRDLTNGKISALNVEGDCFACSGIISEDGRYVVLVVYDLEINGQKTSEYGDIIVYDTQSHEITYVSPPITGIQTNNISEFPTISGNGRYVLFGSEAPNLVLNDENSGSYSLFARDLVEKKTEIVNINKNGKQVTPFVSRAALSNDGRYVAFNIINEILVYDRETKTSIGLGVKGDPISVSDRGIVAFQTDQSLVSQDTNNQSDVYFINFEIIKGKSEKPLEENRVIPDWIRNNANWWSSGQIDDYSFIQGIQWLIENEIIKIPVTQQGTGTSSNEIPEWIRSNAGWWGQGLISDNEFVQGIQWLIQNGVIIV